MGEIEKIAREQIKAVSLENAAASREHARLTARINEMDAELKAREKRLKGIIQSRSWKLSAPLRDIEALRSPVYSGCSRRRFCAASARPAPRASRAQWGCASDGAWSSRLFLHVQLRPSEDLEHRIE
jgi:hypothetical protein